MMLLNIEQPTMNIVTINIEQLNIEHQPTSRQLMNIVTINIVTTVERPRQLMNILNDDDEH